MGHLSMNEESILTLTPAEKKWLLDALETEIAYHEDLLEPKEKLASEHLQMLRDFLAKVQENKL